MSSSAGMQSFTPACASSRSFILAVVYRSVASHPRNKALLSVVPLLPFRLVVFLFSLAVAAAGGVGAGVILHFLPSIHQPNTIAIDSTRQPQVWDLNADPRLPFDDEAYDAVLCTVSVQYLQQPEAVFTDMRRVLK